MKSTPALLLASTILLSSPAWAEAPNVVVSIKPIHSLVASIMQGVGEPSLIVEGGASPHTYNMKPSNAAALQAAKVVFWVGPGLEAFLDTTVGMLWRALVLWVAVLGGATLVGAFARLLA